MKLKEITYAFSLIAKGNTSKDKIILFSSFLKRAFFNIFGKIFKINIKDSLISDVIIKHENYNFFHPKNFFSFRKLDKDSRKELEECLKINAGVFLDIGSNIGEFTILVGLKLKDKGRVISIEAHPTNFRILKKNIKINKMKNVIPLNLACSNSNEELILYTGSGPTTHSLLPPNPNNQLPLVCEDGIKVKSRKLDDIIKNLKIDKVDLIKIDVEGAEEDVIKGGIELLKKSHPKIIFEAWDKTYFDRIKKILIPLNYKIKRIDHINYLAY